MPAKIIGSTIMAMGTLPGNTGIEGGGLVIDYTPEGESIPSRVVFGFNELSLWVEFCN